MKFIRKILLYANIITIIGMVLTGYSGFINPEEYHIIALIGFGFPAFFFGNMVFLLMWALIRPRNTVVPIAGFLIAYSPVQTYCPFNVPADAPEGSLKVLSYNVLSFNSEEEGPNRIMEYVLHSDADIVCIQEFYPVSRQDSLWHLLDSAYQYQDTLRSIGWGAPGGAPVAVLSKYPILSKSHIPMVTRGNTLGVFDIDINGETVHVINAHLETVGLSEEQKSGFSKLVHGKTERDSIKDESKFLAHKIADAMVVRAPQADSIDNYIRRHSGERIILCGDFNDHPLSYVHNTIASRLTDCYRSAGFGPGYSFHYHSMYFRIDNIMCSDHWQPYQCEVDKSIDLSDHYPISCYLKPQKQAE